MWCDLRSLIAGANLEGIVGVDFEGDLYLGDTALGGGDTGKFELAEVVVVFGQRTLTLEYLYNLLVQCAKNK